MLLLRATSAIHEGRAVEDDSRCAHKYQRPRLLSPRLVLSRRRRLRCQAKLRIDSDTVIIAYAGESAPGSGSPRLPRAPLVYLLSHLQPTSNDVTFFFRPDLTYPPPAPPACPGYSRGRPFDRTPRVGRRSRQVLRRRTVQVLQRLVPGRRDKRGDQREVRPVRRGPNRHRGGRVVHMAFRGGEDSTEIVASGTASVGRKAV